MTRAKRLVTGTQRLVTCRSRSTVSEPVRLTMPFGAISSALNRLPRLPVVEYCNRTGIMMVDERHR